MNGVRSGSVMVRPGEGFAEVPLETRHFEDLGRYLLEPMIERVRVAEQHAGELLAGRTVWMVNSTALGGGVAHLLRTLLPYWKGAGIDVRWVVLLGSGEFFRVTKRFHNHLQGQPGDGDVLGIEELTTLDRAAFYHARALASLVAPAGGEHREGERDPAAGRGGGQEEPAGGVRPGSDRGDVEGPSRRRERRGGSSGAGPASARRAAGRGPSRYRGVRRCDRGAPARTAGGRPARPGRARTGSRPVPQRPALRALGGGLRLGARAASRSPQINGPRGGRASAPMVRYRGARSW